MRLHTRLSVMFYVVAGALVLAVLAAADRYGLGMLKPLVISFALVTAVLLLVRALFTARVRRRFEAARAAGDGAEMRRALADMYDRPGLAPATIAMRRLHEAASFTVEDRWAEARAVLEKIDPAHLEPRLVLVRESVLAMVLARLGDVDAALAMVREVQPKLDARAAELCEPSLATALFAARRPAEALPLLERALKRAGSNLRMRAACAYGLGEALHALGRVAEAHDAWRTAAREQPNGKYGRRAQARLDQPKQPYR